LKTLNQLSDYFIDKQEKQTKKEGKVPEWWEGVTTLSINAVNQFEKEHKDLQHHKDTTVGLWALDRDPKKLLQEFWQRSSDACPLECIEAEKQEKEFEAFVEKLCFQIK